MQDEVLDIRLFGGLRVACRGQPVAGLGSARQQALIAWLLLHADVPQTRRRIAFAFWPDSQERQALTNLRRELHHLRQILPNAGRYLEITPQTLHWRASALCRLDTAQFERALPGFRADSGPGSQRANLEQAVALYRGELLAGIHDDWIEPFRQAFHQRTIEALEQLIVLCEQQGEIEHAVACAQRLLELEPVSESTYARLMRIHLARGDRALALRTFHQCAQVLKQELGARPGSVVQRAYRELLEAAAPPPPTLPNELPLIGRKAEWVRLLELWLDLPGAGARAVVISGEAGIGKSRLGEALLAKAKDDGALAARTRSYAAEGHLAFAPLGDWLRSPALQANLARLDKPWLSELTRLLPELLQTYPELPVPQPPTEGWQRQRLFEALARAFLIGDAPIVLLFDDLQWCDRDTLEWLHYLMRFAPQLPLLLLCTMRSEEQDDNPALGELLRHLQQQELLHLIELGPLSADESATLAVSVAGSALDPTVQTRLFNATEGQPLFIVETVRAGLALEAEDDDAPGIALSPKGQAIIAARLAQLSDTARGVAQLAATIGRAFDVKVLRMAGNLAEEPLVGALDELWRRSIIREQQGATTTTANYDFSHDRLREGAYLQLSPARRRMVHRRVAQALEQLHSADLQRVSARLAAHYEQAGENGKAIEFYEQAVEHANDVSASREAIRLARRALALLGQRNASASRDRQELALHNALAAAISALRGFSPPELEAILNRARQLAEALGDEAAVIRNLWGLYTLHIVRGDIRLARSLAEQALSLAEEDTALLTDCHQALGGVDLTEADLSAANAHFATANRPYQQHGARRVLFGADVGVFSRAWGAHGLWLQGEIEQAREQVARAESIAAALAHPFTTMQASAYRSIYWQLERHLDAAWISAEATVAGCDQYNFGYYREWGVIVGGWVQAQRDDVDAGTERIRRGLEALRLQGNYLRRPYYLALLAEVCPATDQSGEARALLDAAMTVAQQNRDLWWLPELWRLRGLTTEADTRAETCFRRALSLAREQGSRSLALRAALSLAVWLRENGRSQEAVAQLEPLCTDFPERLESHDLTAARALLNEQ